MYQKDAEVLFPPRVIAMLQHLRSDPWQQLVRRMLALPENHPDVLAFSLFMIRLNGCLSCHANSFRATRGCTTCAQQSIIRFKETDDQLVALWGTAHYEILYWLETGVPPVVNS